MKNSPDVLSEIILKKSPTNLNFNNKKEKWVIRKDKLGHKRLSLGVQYLNNRDPKKKKKEQKRKEEIAK